VGSIVSIRMDAAMEKFPVIQMICISLPLKGWCATNRGWYGRDALFL